MAEARAKGDVRARPGDAPAGRIVEIMDERDPLADAALALIAQSFAQHERHPTSVLREEIAERRLGLLADHIYHLLALVGPGGEPMAVVAGRYLAGVNAGFVTYLAVRPELRGQGAGLQVRSALVEAFRADARASRRDDLAWVLGEVRLKSAWLHALVSRGRAVPFDFTYYHPGMLPSASDDPYLLYRQPVLDKRSVLATDEVRRILYAIWRRAYRVAYPLRHEAFQAMLDELEGREMVGAHPGVGTSARSEARH